MLNDILITAPPSLYSLYLGLSVSYWPTHTFLFSFQAVLLNRNVPTPKNPTIPWFSKIPWLKIHDPARPCLSRLTSFFWRGNFQLWHILGRALKCRLLATSGNPAAQKAVISPCTCVWWGEHFYCLLDEKHRLTFQNDRGQYDIEDTKNWRQDNSTQGNNFVDCPSLTV